MQYPALVQEPHFIINKASFAATPACGTAAAGCTRGVFIHWICFCFHRPLARTGVPQRAHAPPTAVLLYVRRQPRPSRSGSSSVYSSGPAPFSCANKVQRHPSPPVLRNLQRSQRMGANRAVQGLLRRDARQHEQRGDVACQPKRDIRIQTCPQRPPSAHEWPLVASAELGWDAHGRQPCISRAVRCRSCRRCARA